MITAGIDAGSRAIKIVLFDHARGAVVGQSVMDQGVDHQRLATQLFDALLREHHLERAAITRVVATGYARNSLLLADTTITEITCHAAGVLHLMPDTATVIEIGGQDSKLIWLTPAGTVRDFAMNDRCAAGTGCFLEMVARRLEVTLDALGDLAAASTAPAPISNTCVVFAETEIIGLLVAGAAPADIVAGVQAAVAARIAAMAVGRAQPPVLFTGGVALLPGMAQALSAALGHPISVPPTPQFTGALGAAVLAGR